MLLVGQVLKHISMKTGFQYTPLCALVGFIFGCFPALHPNEEFGHIWTNMNPDFLMFCFLPCLIFESAFTCDWHTFKVQLMRILLLAMPVLLAATYLTAYVFYYVLNYKEDMSFEACILFGAMISATDPVAVVSLLKELGTPKSIGTLIEGESLLNDGTAVVVFQVARTFV
jgi:NhaP-type Na+/H+ or K+/H+ antiporter